MGMGGGPIDWTRKRNGYYTEAAPLADELTSRVVLFEQDVEGWSGPVRSGPNRRAEVWRDLDYSTVGIEGIPPDAVAAAWREYKATHNPPGMWVGFAGILPDCTEAWTRIGLCTPFAQMELGASRKVVLTDEGSEWRFVGREDAWAHYDRCLEIAAKVEAAGLIVPCGERLEVVEPWPHCLSWWAEECDDVERYIEDNTKPAPDILVWCTEATRRSATT